MFGFASNLSKIMALCVDNVVCYYLSINMGQKQNKVCNDYCIDEPVFKA